MAIIFSSNNIPELASYTLKERQIILSLASDKLITPEKLVINLLKLFVLIPPFIFIARLETLLIVISLAACLASYLFVMRPISLYFLKKHLPKAISQFEKQKS